MAKKTTKRSNRPSKGINRYQEILRKTGSNIVQLQYSVMNRMSHSDIRRNYKRAHSHPALKKTLVRKSNNFSTFYTPLFDMTLETTLVWVECTLIHHKKEVSAFIKLEKEITLLILKGAYENALELVNEAEDLCGVSLWGVQLRSYLISKIEGIDQAKQYLKETSAQCQSPLCKFIINNLSERLEDDAVFYAYSKDLNRRLNDSFGEDKDLLSLLKYRILPGCLHHSVDSKSIIFSEMKTSIVDLYKAVIFCISNEIYKSQESPEPWKKLLKSLSDSINGSTLRSLELSLSNCSDSFISNIDNQELDIIDLYTSGEYADVARSLEENEALLSEFSFFEIYVKSISRLEGKRSCNLSERSELLTEVLSFGEDLFSSKVKLFNESFRIGNLEWFFNQGIFLTINSSTIREIERKSLGRMLSSRSTIMSAFKFEGAPQAASDAVVNAILLSKPHSKSTELFRAFSSCDETSASLEEIDIPDYRLNKYLGIRSLNQGNPEKAIEYFERACQSGDNITKGEIRRWSALALIDAKKLDEASEMISKGYIQNPDEFSTYPLDVLCDHINSEFHETKKSSFHRIICLYLYSRTYDDSLLTLLKVSFEYFMSMYCPRDFTELLDRKHELSEEEVGFFLERVFVPSVMKGPIFFSSTDEVNSTRIRICQHLLDNGIGDKAGIQSEIKARSKEIVLKDAKLYVDNTKIYVDMEYVKNQVEAECRKLFSVFQGMSHENEDDERILSVVVDALKSAPELEFYSSLAIAHTTNVEQSDRSKTLSSIMKSVRNEFIDGLKGLSGYLSTRIRHGTLENHYRQSLQDGLLLKKCTASNDFRYELPARLDKCTDEEKRAVDEALAEFNESFDKVIDKILNDWLRFYQVDLDFASISKKNNEAVFNYSISNTLVHAIQEKLSESSTYEDLWKVLEGWLWNVTDCNLAHMTRVLETKLYPMFKDSFDTLLEAISSIPPSGSNKFRPIVDTIASSRESLNAGIQESERWFTRSSQGIGQDIDLDLIFEIVDRSLAVSSSRSDSDGILIKGSEISYYVDIIYVIYANALKHSMTDKDSVNLNSEISSSDGIMSIEITNHCAPISNYDQANEQLKSYCNIYKREEGIERLSAEGDTGFYKIQKILKEDLGLDFNLQIRYHDECTFKVTLEVNHENPPS